MTTFQSCGGKAPDICYHCSISRALHGTDGACPSFNTAAAQNSADWNELQRSIGEPGEIASYKVYVNERRRPNIEAALNADLPKPRGPILPTAPDFLQKAANIMAQRGQQYDKPDGERSMARTVAAFNEITGQDLTEAQGWLLMQVLKSVRLFTREGYHADSAEDNVSYAALLGEAKAREVTP